MAQNTISSKSSTKKFSTAVVLSAFFGLLGIHHFYLNRLAMGFFDLGLSIVAFSLYIMGYHVVALCLFTVDLIHTVVVTYHLLTGQYKDGKGYIVTYPGQKI